MGHYFLDTQYTYTYWVDRAEPEVLAGCGERGPGQDGEDPGLCRTIVKSHLLGTNYRHVTGLFSCTAWPIALTNNIYYLIAMVAFLFIDFI